MNKQRFYFRSFATGGSSPDPAVYCPANGYILDPDIPPPPLFEIPSGETDEKIVLIVSSELDSAVSFTATITNTGQFKTQVYDMAGTLKYTVNTNNIATLNLNLPTSYGTLQPEGFYLFKVVITATLGTNTISAFIIRTRSGYAVNGWPIKEMHFYTPNLTSLTTMSSGLCKIMTYVKFYSNCNSITTIQSFLSSSTSLKEVVLPAQMNALRNASLAFSYCTALRKIQWPTSLPVLTTLASCFAYSGLKKCTPTENPLPTSLPLLASMVQMFEYNTTIETIEIANDLPALTDMNKFTWNASQLKTIKFTGTVGEPTAGVNFDLMCSASPLLTQITFPPVFYCKGGGQIQQTQNCTSLKKVVLPQTVTYYITSLTNFSIFGRFNECVSLEEFTEITAGGNTVCANLFFNSVRKLATFWQPRLRLHGATMNSTASNPSILSSFECNWAEIQNSNSLGGSISFAFGYCQFQTAEINRIFTALPTVTVSATIDFRNNPGYAACDKTIATAKGWTVP